MTDAGESDVDVPGELRGDAAPNSDGVRIVDLMLEIRDMPERRTQIDLDCLERTTVVFHRNYIQLKKFLDICETDPENQDLWHMHSARKQEEFANETWRLLHNFVAAAFTAVEHTRILYRRLNAEGEFPEYQARIDASFKTNRLAQFVQGLRNYVLHQGGGELYFTGKIDVKTGRADVRLTLKTTTLLRWDGWNRHAKRYLADSGDSVHIASLARDYHDSVKDFQIWFGGRQREVRRAELDRVREKEMEYWALELNTRLSGFENRTSEAGMGETGLFIGLFDYSDYRELERLPRGSEERVECALGKLRERFPVPTNIEARIRGVYHSTTFLPAE